MNQVIEMLRESTSVRGAIEDLFATTFREQAQAEPPQVKDDLVLLECGLDSLAFAILVTRLEERLGFDPFTMSDEPFYPRTFGEFVAFYERHAP